MTNSDLTTDVDVLVVGAGQAGLAAGMALRQAGLGFMIVDAAGQPGGSWPRYYDSLTLFSWHPALTVALPAEPTADSPRPLTTPRLLHQLPSGDTSSGQHPPGELFAHLHQFLQFHVPHRPVNTRPQGRLRQRRARKLDADQRTMFRRLGR